MTSAERSTYMKNRRARLMREGLCVDCGKHSAKDPAEPDKPHVVCVGCRKDRRDRLAANVRQYTLALGEATL